MAYANSPEKVSSLRAIVPPRREANGRKQRSTTRQGQADEIAGRERETEEQAMRIALDQPHRRALPATRVDDSGRRVPIHPSDPLAGFALGRLFLHGAIQRDQLTAGQRYAQITMRHMRHITGHLPRFPSQAISDSAGGLDCSAEMSDDEAFKIRRSYAEMQTALADTQEWHACVSALSSVCVMDREPKSEAEMGALRIGLNALHRLWS